MTRSMMTLVMGMMLLLSFAQGSWADWPVTSYPEYRGKILDAETKEPIEGAVAVVYYDRDMLIGGPGGPGSYIFHAKERLTDEKGEFTFPSYTSLHLISEGGCASFIFFKPGYMASYGPEVLENCYMTQDYFTTDEAGKIGEVRAKGGRPAIYQGPLGIVELRKAKTREEILMGSPGAPSSEFRSNKLPLLFKAINEDRKRRGLEGEIK